MDLIRHYCISNVERNDWTNGYGRGRGDGTVDTDKRKRGRGRMVFGRRFL